MFGRQTYVGIVLVATAIFVSAQNNQPLDFRSGSATKALSSAMTASAHDRERSTPGEAEILTDTKGVDLTPYVATVRRIVRSQWVLMIPSQARPPLMKDGKVSIDF